LEKSEKLRQWMRSNEKDKEAMLTEMYCKIMEDNMGGDADENKNDGKMSDKSTSVHANLDRATYMESWSFAKHFVSYERFQEFQRFWDPLSKSCGDLKASLSG